MIDKSVYKADEIIILTDKKGGGKRREERGGIQLFWERGSRGHLLTKGRRNWTGNPQVKRIKLQRLNTVTLPFSEHSLKWHTQIMGR